MTTQKHIWTTEYHERIPVEDMTMAHLHNALTMLENNAEDVNEKLGYLSAPLPEGTRLTEEAEVEVYMLKCQQLQISRWDRILREEVSRRLHVMNKGFSKIVTPTAGPFADDTQRDLPALLRPQAE